MAKTTKKTLLSTQDVADLFNVHPTLVLRWLNDGRMQGEQIGGVWVIRKEDAKYPDYKKFGRPRKEESDDRPKQDTPAKRVTNSST